MVFPPQVWESALMQLLLVYVVILCACVDTLYSPVEVITAIRGYVEHFLGCRECAVNFGRGALRLLDGRHSARYLAERDGAVMWLWRSHNRANHHLRGDVTEDPAHPKVQFPVQESCPACHHGTSWNETAVLQYLVEYYGAANIIDDDVEGAGMESFISIASRSCCYAWLLHGAIVALQILVVCR